MPQPKSPQFDWLLFDADDTLFDFPKAERGALKDVFRALDVAESEENLALYFDINRQLWLELERGGVTAAEVKVERFKRLFLELGVEAEPAHWADEYLVKLADHGELLPGALELLEAVKGQGLPMAIVTNGMSLSQRKRIAAANLDQYFEFLVISEEVGSAKPDEAIFAECWQQMDYSGDKARVLMIGDRIETDIIGGARFGFKTCWYNTDNKANNSQCSPDFEVSHLLDILPLVQG